MFANCSLFDLTKVSYAGGLLIHSDPFALLEDLLAQITLQESPIFRLVFVGTELTNFGLNYIFRN